MIHNKDRFINAAWDSCPGWRLFIYYQFRDALQQPINAIRTNAKFFYLQSMIRDTYTTRTEQLFKALEECVRKNGREREDLPKLEQYKRIVYNDCLEYWGEKPPPAPPQTITHPSSFDYYRNWHG